MSRFISKIFKKTMYPELEKAGGLTEALNIAFAQIKSSYRVENDQNIVNPPFAYSRVEHNNKFSQVYIAAEEKLYLPDFWRDGVCLAHGSIDNLSALAQAIHFWLSNNTTTRELAEKYPFVQANEQAEAFDEGREVEYAWNHLLENSSTPELYEFIKLARNDTVLSKLFPFTSLYTLCFSRCSGYPYDIDGLPNVTPASFKQFATANYNAEGWKDQVNGAPCTHFILTKNRNEFLGAGTAEEALKIVRKNLPFDIKPSRKGRADS